MPQLASPESQGGGQCGNKKAGQHGQIISPYQALEIEVMAIVIKRCVHPLQSRVTPLLFYNGEHDASRYRRRGPDTPTELAMILNDLYKGDKEDFLHLNYREGYSMYNPIEWVRFRLPVSLYCYPDILIRLFFVVTKQSWRKMIEVVYCPAPKPEDHNRDEDPGFYEDPDIYIEFDDGVFCQASLDGSEVPIATDYPRPYPFSIVSI